MATVEDEIAERCEKIGQKVSETPRRLTERQIEIMLIGRPRSGVGGYCANCRVWAATGGSPFAPGECRLKPPAPGRQRPRSRPVDWCGSWAPMVEAEKETAATR